MANPQDAPIPAPSTPAKRTRRTKGPLLKAAQTNDLIATYTALRDNLAAELDGPMSKRDRAGLTLQYMKCLESIAKLGLRADPEEDDAEKAIREALEFTP